MSNNPPMIYKDQPTVDLITINLIDPTIRSSCRLLWQEDKYLSDYLKDIDMTDAVVSVSGNVIEGDYELVRPSAFDSIVVATIPYGDGGGKGIFRLVLTAALAYFSGGLASGLLGQGASLASVNALAAGITLAGSMLINAMLPPPKLDQKQATKEQPNYGIDGAKNTSKEGIVIPVVYGEFRIGGNLIAVHNENINNDQYLYLLFGLCERNISSIDEIEINDQPLLTNGEPTFDGLEIKTYIDGGQAEWFDKIISPINLNRTINDTWDYHTTINPVEQFRFDMVFPGGLIGYDDDDGDPYAITASLTIEYRLAGSADPWVAVGSEYKTNYVSIININGTDYQYPETLPTNYFYFEEIVAYINQTPGGERVTAVIDPLNVNGDIVIQMYADTDNALINEPILSEGLISLTPGDANAITFLNNGLNGLKSADVMLHDGYNKYFAIDGSESLIMIDDYESNVWSDGFGFHASPKVTTITNVIYEIIPGYLSITAQSRSALRRSVFSDVLPLANYEIRYKRLPASLSSYETDDMTVSDINEIVLSNHSYDVAMLAVKVKVSEEFNSLPKITCLPKNGTNNPALIVLNMMLNNEYAAGLPVNKIDMEKFETWKDHCIAQGLTWNGIFDSEDTFWDQIRVVSRAGHAQIINVGTKYSVAIERADKPVMMFNVSNIVKSSFSISWIPLKERANRVEVTYYDKDDGYRQNTAVQENIVNGDTTRPATIELQGIVTKEDAAREALFALNLNRYILQTCEFEAPLEAIACKVGDQVIVQHDMPQWGFGGNTSADSVYTAVQLDREIEMQAGKAYKALFLIDSVMYHSGTCTSETGALNEWKQIAGLVAGTFNLDNARLIVGINDYEILSVSGDFVKLKDNVSLIGQTCEVHLTDLIYEKNVVLNVGTQTIIALDTPLDYTVTIPRHTRFMFGENNKVKKPFRVVRIAGKDVETRKLTCVEYNSTVYDFNTPTVPTPNYSSLASRALPVIDSTSINVEKYVYYDAGVFKNKINLQFSRPSYNTDLSVYVDKYEMVAYIKEAGPQESTSIFIPKPKMEAIVSKDFMDVPGGHTYVVRVRAISTDSNKYSNGFWSKEIEIFVEDVHDYLSAINLPDPINPKLFATLNEETNTIDKIRIDSGYDIGTTPLPSGVGGFYMFYSSFDAPNQIKIDQDLDTVLRIAFEEDDFIDQSTPETEVTLLAGSTDSKLIVKTLNDPFVPGTDLANQWWIQVYDPANPSTIFSEWRMVTSYDETSLYLGEPGDITRNLDIIPQAGYKVRYVHFAWTDQRDTEFQMSYIENSNGDYEIIKWGGIEQIGNYFYLVDCVRAQEGTAKINIAGNHVSYYPAPGKGTMIAAIPITEFKQLAPKQFQAISTQNISIIPDSYMSISCCVAVEVGKHKYYRSNIVPLAFGGQL